MKVAIFDTTLRDGEQAPGFGMNPADKLRMALQLESLGVDVVEAGFPAASVSDARAVADIARAVRKPVVCALARAVEGDILAAAKALRGAARPRLHIFLATSDLHLKYKLHKTRDDVLDLAAKSVAMARKLCPEVEFSAEDASRTDMEFLCRVADVAVRSGATIINLPDTVGYATPDDISKMVSCVSGRIGGDAVVSVHCHDDLGLAVANTLAGLRAGACQAECSICGIGERAGNAALEEVAVGIATRPDAWGGLSTGVKLRHISQTARLLQAITGVKIQPNKAIVGRNAFAHESGIHQHGVLAKSETYEIISPESVGVHLDSIVLGRHSGRHAFAMHLKELGFEPDATQIDAIFAEFKKLAERKKTVTDRDISALAESATASAGKTGYWALASFSVTSNNSGDSLARITLRHGRVERTEFAAGNGPIFSAFMALEKIAGVVFKLEDYRLQAVTERRDALGEAFVKISGCKGEFRGRGVSTDVIEASILACLSAVNAMIATSFPRK